MKTKFEEIEFEEAQKVDDKPRFHCNSKKNGDRLGIVAFNPLRRKYIFWMFHVDAVWTAGCLRDVAAFLDEVNGAKEGQDSKF